MLSNEIKIVNPETGEVRIFKTMEEYIAARDAALVKWQASKAALDAAKDTEMEDRKNAVFLMHDPAKSGSTENVELGGGYKATFKVPVTYGFIKKGDKVDKAAIEKALTKIEKNSAAGELIAERLVKWTPVLSMTEYKQLSEKDKAAIDAVIVTSEGSPSLEIKEPKAK